MCDQTPVEYKDGDIVWVKLGSCWWPGEVQDLKNIDEETLSGLKKPIIAAVKFFDEDYYEFIKSIDRIYLYNCSKKNEFIKKGLDLHRAKHEYMKKFPTDVSKAEERTNGNPNIIDDPIFAPEKRSNIAALIFGTSKQKKTPRKSIGSGHKSLGSKSPASTTKSAKQRLITHPRFLGFDDHEVRILVQSSEQVVTLEDEEEKLMYKCAACGFSTERVDVSIMHHKSHIQGLFPVSVTSPKLKKRTQTKRPRKSKMTKSKTTSIMEDLQLIEKGLFFHSESSEDDGLDEQSAPKRKRKKAKRKSSKNVTSQKPGVETAIVDIRGDLLAEWDEDDSDTERDITTFNTSHSVDVIEKNDELIEAVVTKEKSCFDFNEDDEDEIVSTSAGRKIPRVIPHPDRPKSVELTNSDRVLQSLENAELTVGSPPCLDVEINRESPVENTNSNIELSVDSALDRNEILKIIHQVDESSSEETLPVQLGKVNEDLLEKDKIEDLDLAFKDILEATSVPELPEIPHSLKFGQSCYDSNVAKLPEKPISEIKPLDTEMAAKLINPKKRFVKSFEDFEQQIHNEQRKLQLEQAVTAVKEKNEGTLPEEKEPVKVENTVEVAKLKTQLKNKLDKSEHADESKPKRPRLLRDRILSSHREELDDLHKEVPKEFDLIDTHATVTSDYSSVTSLPRATSTVPDDLLESSYTITSDEKENVQSELLPVAVEDVTVGCSNSFPNSSVAQVEAITEPVIEDVEYIRSRRLSIKMSEVNETPFELKETTQLLEVEAEETLHLKPTQVFDSKETVNISEVEPHIETQTVNIISKTAEVENLQVDQIDVVDESKLLQDSHILEEVEILEKIEPINETRDEEKIKMIGEVQIADAVKVSEVVATVQGKIETSVETDIYEGEIKVSEGIEMSDQSKMYKRDIEVPEQIEMCEESKVYEEDIKVAEEIEVAEELKVYEEDIKESEEIEAFDEAKQVETEEVSFKGEQIIAESVTSEFMERADEALHVEDKPPAQPDSSIVNTTNECVPISTFTGDAFSLTLDSQSGVEDLSALATLATVSQLSTNLDINSTVVNEKSKIIEDNLTSIEKSNLNFVTMDDLAEGQVEISDVCVSKVKSNPMNLMNFSVDFGDSNETVNSSLSSGKVASPASNISEEEIHQPDSIEMSLGKVFEGENEASRSDSQISESKGDCIQEESCSSVISNNAKPFLRKVKKNISEKIKQPEYSSSSKLLEILTDAKPKSSHLDVSEQSTKTIVTMPVTESSSNKILTKSKNEKFCSNKESGHFAKHLLKSKEAFKEIPIGKVLPKLKDEKLYSISKETPPVIKNATNYEGKNPKFILKSTSTLKPYTPNKSSKPVILSEKIIKRLPESQEGVSVRKVTSNNAQDFEDIDAYIIQKPLKKVIPREEEIGDPPLSKKPVASKGKAKILQQTIIKPATTELTQQPVPSSVDDAMFDINSMPIVLGDQILTTEGIEKIPVVLSEEQEVVSASISTKSTDPHLVISNKTVTPQPLILKTYSSQKLNKPRVYQSSPSSTTKILKSNPTIISRPGKQDKYIILPSSTSPTASKYTVGKRQSAAKRMTPVILPTPSASQKVQPTTTTEPSGNKIMIVTNQQGQQSRVLLTPAQQKLFGYQTAGSKLVKSTIKGNILQKTGGKGVSPVTKIQHPISNEVPTSTQTILSTESVLVSVKGSPLRPIKADLSKSNRKFQIQQQMVPLQEGLSTFKNSSIPNQQKTIIIKNQQGQIVKKFHGTDDALLEQQVAEQVQAIKANSSSFSPVNLTTKVKPPVKRTYIKKQEAQRGMKMSTKIIKTETVPPLAPISPKRSDSVVLPQTVLKSDSPCKSEPVPQKPLNQLIIQDGQGNQTTIMEGQILALPSGETVDGQPQSYMLVTLDESGNLAPLNNEALLSLDPNLTLGGDLSNMVLQLDDGTAKKGLAKVETTATSDEPLKTVEAVELPKTETFVDSNTKLESETLPSTDSQANMQTVTCSINNDPNQQLIITGDPISTQKFIESLTEGNADLANLLASAEGNILIQTDEQQILINTDSENQVLLPLGSDRLVSSESDSNPIFASQPVKNQDILAAALADTDVFQQEQAISPIHNKLGQSQLSPNSGLYQAGVGNVLETTLSLSSPIMTPLEVPSSNNKKIPDEEMDILTTEVPKNVDLPITITDPNISQTVAQQQVVSLMTNELTANLELPLTIPDQGVVPSTEMHSPSYGFPLPSLEEAVTSVDAQKSFSGPISMPLLTEEDPQESNISEVAIEESENNEQEEKTSSDVNKDVRECSEKNETSIIKRKPLFESTPLTDSIIKDEGKSLPPRTFLGTSVVSEEGLCTLGGAMCSSLSEPPPDMFDLSIVGSHFVTDPDIKNSIASGLRTDLIESNLIPKSTSSERITEMNENSREFNKYESYGENKIDNDLLNPPLSSNTNSPVVNVDENSCEIPVQPQIVTDLSSSSFENMDVSNFEPTKTAEDDESNGRKKFD